MAWVDEQKIATTQIARGVDQTVQPVVGDILVATASGYVQYAISVPAANVRNVLGVDNGETTPTWKTALDSTTPAAVDAAGSPGTSLIFSHRDHVHPQDTALTAVDFLVGTATGELSGEIVAGTTPGGELGGTWGSPTVDSVHSGSAHHAAVTLAADADTVLSLSTQEIGLDTQTANTLFAGPTSGGAADPTFRAMVAADLVSHDNTKHANRTRTVPLSITSALLQNSATFVEGYGPKIQCPDAVAATFYLTFSTPTDWDGVTNPVLKVLWYTTAASGNLVYHAVFDGRTDGDTWPSSWAQDTGNLTQASAGASIIETISITVTALAATDQTMSFAVERLGAEAADTLGADVFFVAVWLEYTADM